MTLTPQIIKQKITPILKRQGVTKAALFGSVARGEAKRSSDIDLLIAFKGRKSLLDLVGLQLELQDLLGKKVDVVTYRSLHPRLKPYIMREAIRIL
jgi:hypothetical protein